MNEKKVCCCCCFSYLTTTTTNIITTTTTAINELIFFHHHHHHPHWIHCIKSFPRTRTRKKHPEEKLTPKKPKKRMRLILNCFQIQFRFFRSFVSFYFSLNIETNKSYFFRFFFSLRLSGRSLRSLLRCCFSR